MDSVKSTDFPERHRNPPIAWRAAIRKIHRSRCTVYPVSNGHRTLLSLGLQVLARNDAVGRAIGAGRARIRVYVQLSTFTCEPLMKVGGSSKLGLVKYLALLSASKFP